MPGYTRHHRPPDTVCQPRLITLLCLLSLAFTVALCHAESHTESPHDTSHVSADQAAPVAVGFDLGQSYATSVAHFSNGSVVNLAKVSGDDEYAALMARLVQMPSQHLLSLSQIPGRTAALWRLMMRSLVRAPSRDAAVLSGIVASLKAKSEAVLGHTIDSAAVTAPWIASWKDDIPYDSMVNDVLALAGIEPVSWEASNPTYLGEANSLLAANKRLLCPERWCADDMDPYEPQPVSFLISFTNQSLYTSFQQARCFFLDSWDTTLGTIDLRYGLDRLEESGRPEVFWASLSRYLLECLAEYSKRFPDSPPSLILVAGEAANAPPFITILQEFTKSIPDIHEPGAKVDKQPDTTSSRVDLIISENPTFAAARGAAFWMRTRLDWSYCDDFYTAHPGEYLSQGDMRSHAHVEL